MLFFAVGIALALKKRSTLEVFGLISGWVLVILFLVHGPIAKAVNHFSSLKPFAEQVKKIHSPLAHYGEAREDLLYYLGRPVLETHGEEGVRHVIEHSEAVLLVKGSQSGPLLERFPRLRVILETKELFLYYRLLGTTPVSPKP